MLSGLRVLVVEGQFLIALDLQRILEEAHAARTVLARSATEAADLAGRFREFDVALVELPPGEPATLELVRRLVAAGVGVAVTTTGADISHHLPGFPGVPAVHKPFDDTELLAAIAEALAARRLPD
jgi:CheY-like chemotaxis protein